MNPLEEIDVLCPYCNEIITLLIDCSQSQQSYTEDCFVCCRPIVVIVHLPLYDPLYDPMAMDSTAEQGTDDDLALSVQVRREDD